MVAALVLLGLEAPALGALVPESGLTASGLERVWIAQAQVDPTQGGNVNAVLHGDAIYVLSSKGVVQAFDAQTGATRWTHRYGDPEQPSYGPTVHSRYKPKALEAGAAAPSKKDAPLDQTESVLDEQLVAIANGTTVYLLDAATGRVRIRDNRPSTAALIDSREARLEKQPTPVIFRLPGAPGGAPIVADYRVFAPLVDGRIVGLPHDEVRGIPWTYTSSGQSYASPTLLPAPVNRVVWTTTAGLLYCGYDDGRGVAFRFRGAAPLVGPAAVKDASVVIPTTTGLVYAVNATSGQQIWRKSVGSDVRQPAVIAGNVAYVGSTEPALHALDATTGANLWSVEGVDQFVAASADRVYATSPDGRLAIIRPGKAGATARWADATNVTAIPNRENDRLYLVSPEGLIQCLREQGPEDSPPAAAPDTPPAAEAAPTDETPAKETPGSSPIDDPTTDEATPDQPAADDDPFAVADDGGQDDPFAESAPADEPAEEEPAAEEPAAEEPAEDLAPPADDDPFADPFQ
ncbi:outer membrane protein assembly factor BamB family protein [Botrimarina hoheduenensis]|uniref:Serine/threonine-protein kinase AfsK n=1 Tax=Botrimarina hoheduenensis TaxID=2528000 RepID=A0A5C5W8M5_9BACT|nr:PQQ-binding-like beta-propeller repeat protein [Botrimarina hoheduenensis]TWT47248.1 Serine/threonine-protein kinase AfsK [Botrimarina hoheduenensis]